MYRNNQKKQCLICFNDINKYPSLYHLLYQPTLCLKCLNKFAIYNCHHYYHGYPLIILYYYNDFFKNILFQYKGQGDYALKDAFLNSFPNLKRKYHKHTIAIIPSSKHDNIKRGFNPNEMIARSFNDNIFTGLFKINDYKQTKQTDRSLVNKIIKINDGEQLYNKDVIIFDDVITSGNTIMTCTKIIESYQPRSITLLVMASNQLNELFK